MACAFNTVALSVWSISSVGKYVVSMLEVRRGSNGARMRRRLSKSTPRKKAWFLISWAPSLPRRFSVLHTMLLINVSVIPLLCLVVGNEIGLESDIPPDQVLGLDTQSDIIGEVQSLSPVHDLTVRVVAVLGAERRPANKALEHNRSEGPPIAVERVTMASENL